MSGSKTLTNVFEQGCNNAVPPHLFFIIPRFFAFVYNLVQKNISNFIGNHLTKYGI